MVSCFGQVGERTLKVKYPFPDSGGRDPLCTQEKNVRNGSQRRVLTSWTLPVSSPTNLYFCISSMWALLPISRGSFCRTNELFEKGQNKTCKTTEMLDLIILISYNCTTSVSSILSIEDTHQIQMNLSRWTAEQSKDPKIGWEVSVISSMENSCPSNSKQIPDVTRVTLLLE